MCVCVCLCVSVCVQSCVCVRACVCVRLQHRASIQSLTASWTTRCTTWAATPCSASEFRRKTTLNGTRESLWVGIPCFQSARDRAQLVSHFTWGTKTPGLLRNYPHTQFHLIIHGFFLLWVCITADVYLSALQSTFAWLRCGQTPFFYFWTKHDLRHVITTHALFKNKFGGETQSPDVNYM